jgi:hypothetical protein
MRRTIFSSGFIGRLAIVALSATLAAMLFVAALTSTGAAQATKTANVEEGFVGGDPAQGGLADREFPGRGVPLLKTVNFQFVPSYKKCVPVETGDCFDQVDHHINSILIDPKTLAFHQGRIRIGFTDKFPDDPFYYNVQHYLEFNPSIRRFDTGYNQAVGHATDKTISRPTPASDYEFVLIGFELRFLRNDNQGGLPLPDHHINEVGIIENDGKVTVDFNDENFDDRFQYRIQYAYVPREMFITSGLGESSGIAARDFAQQDIPSGPAVIRGFRFDFRLTCIGLTICGDHHLKKIAVINQGGRVQVRYADKNGDDFFTWRVKWGILK